MTFHYSDGASYQQGINLAGEIAFFSKITEGTGYSSPAFSGQAENSKNNNVWLGAYHFLLQGDAVAQAHFCHAQLAARGRPKIPVMADVEPRQFNAPEMTRQESRAKFEEDAARLIPAGLTAMDARQEMTAAGWSLPTISETISFASWMQALGHPCHLNYYPHWYWQQQGSPSLEALSNVSMLLVASNYTTYSDDGPGWDSYGGIKVAAWQHADDSTVNGMSNVDRNAFRGSLSSSHKVTFEEFRTAARTGRQPSLVHYSGITGVPISTLLRWTLNAHKTFPVWLSEYIQAGNLSNTMRFGTTIQTVKP